MTDSSKLKELADDSYKFDENDRKLQAISPIPTVFSKGLYCRYKKPGLVLKMVELCTKLQNFRPAQCDTNYVAELFDSFDVNYLRDHSQECFPSFSPKFHKFEN